MEDCTNIEAGDTEVILSTIYWITTKMVLKENMEDDDPATVACCKLFISKFGARALEVGMKNLERNLQRDEEDDDEKYLLSLSIVNFIKACSHVPEMIPCFNSGNILKELLWNEDVFSSKVL